MTEVGLSRVHRDRFLSPMGKCCFPARAGPDTQIAAVSLLTKTKKAHPNFSVSCECVWDITGKTNLSGD